MVGFPQRPSRRRRFNYDRHRNMAELEDFYFFMEDRWLEWKLSQEEEKKKEDEKKPKETFFTRKFTFGQMLFHSMWIGPLVGSIYFGFIFSLLRSRGLI